MSKKTDFGFTQVEPEVKTSKVKAVFDSVQQHYDLMNDVMSLGIHRLWKTWAIELSALRAHHKVLDLAAGSGDISARIAKIIGTDGLLISSDINSNMLKCCRDKLINQNLRRNVYYVQANAESLPFADNYFDHISIAFGLRNVTDKAQALREMSRCLKPGGQLWVLEFSSPAGGWLKKCYDSYSFTIIPKLGEFITGDKASYQYLVESIRMHPDQDSLKALIEANGFSDCHYHNFSAGIVALHQAQAI